MRSSFKVIAKNVSTFSISEEKKRAINELEIVTGLMEKFLKILEKKFKEVIWYIGTDVLDEENITERFMFKKSGFMEISLKTNAEIKAFFSSKKRALKFINAYEKTRKEYCKNYSPDILGRLKLMD